MGVERDKLIKDTREELERTQRRSNTLQQRLAAYPEGPAEWRHTLEGEIELLLVLTHSKEKLLTNLNRTPKPADPGVEEWTTGLKRVAAQHHIWDVRVNAGTWFTLEETRDSKISHLPDRGLYVNVDGEHFILTIGEGLNVDEIGLPGNQVMYVLPHGLGEDTRDIYETLRSRHDYETATTTLLAALAEVAGQEQPGRREAQARGMRL